MWRDEAKFKNLGTESELERAALTAFGVAVARSVLSATQAANAVAYPTATDLRSAILDRSEFVDLPNLIATSWALGIPVIQLALFPIGAKRMHAMTVRVESAHAIVLGRESRFPAQVAYTLAHEIGHVLSGHLTDSGALVEMRDPLRGIDDDTEEAESDGFALTLLTGADQPYVIPTIPQFSSLELASAVMDRGPSMRIEPGTLALLTGHATGRWPQVMNALKLIPPGETDVGLLVNGIAVSQLEWDALSADAQDYLRRVMGLAAIR